MSPAGIKCIEFVHIQFLYFYIIAKKKNDFFTHWINFKK